MMYYHNRSAQRHEIDHPRTERKLTGTHVRCPQCKGRLNVTVFGSIRSFQCSGHSPSKSGCGYSFDENILNARNEERGGR
jgi:hypothetical protein